MKTSVRQFYRTVDENADYDPIDIRGRDEEEKWFDSMEPESAEEDLDSDSDCWTKPRHSDTADWAVMALDGPEPAQSLYSRLTSTSHPRI